jgi:hypothetical protein
MNSNKQTGMVTKTINVLLSTLALDLASVHLVEAQQSGKAPG